MLPLRRRPAPALTPLAPALLPLAAALACSLAQAQSDNPTVVITGSVRAQLAQNAPYAIGSVDQQTLRDAGPMVNLSEALVRVPGLVVANRNNYAQDLQISSRGFGARATFGVRGIRLYTDGIPASGPDGQGQVAHFDLASAQRVEVLRGPFSVLYGASSGGVIALFSAPVRRGELELGQDLGADGLAQTRFAVAAPLAGGLDLRASASSMTLDGFRPQSQASRDLLNLRLGYTGAHDSLVLLLNRHEQEAQDPLGLDATDLATNPRGTNASATGADTRKTVAQNQAGLSWRHRFDGTGWLRETSVAAYSGNRAVTQFLAIPGTTQRNPALTAESAAWRRHGGGVVDFSRSYQGLDARAVLGFDGIDVVAGVALDRQEDDRRGYENFTGTPRGTLVPGVIGNLRRDETNVAKSLDGYLQGEFTLSPAFSATAGVRSGQMKVSVADRYFFDPVNFPERLGNRDDSGSRSFSYTNPVAGLRWTVNPGWTVHASVARGYETPTLGEMAYTSNNSGPNLTLQGQTSRQFELGTKWRGAGVELDAALFRVNASNEIVVLSSSGGRAVFQNAPGTRRQGLELGARWQLSPSLRLAAAATALQATYTADFQTCPGNPCPTAANPIRTVTAGNRIAGTQRRMGFAELAWKPGVVPGEFALEARGQSRTAANDLNEAMAAGFSVLNLRWSHDWDLAGLGTLQTLARVDNALDRVHVGSVIVNDANGRFYEPGAPRSVMLGLRWKKSF